MAYKPRPEWHNNYMGKKEYNAEWAKRNPDKVREIQRRYHKAHPDKSRERTASWRRKNLARALHSRAKKSAIASKLGCDITREDVTRMLAPMTCSATGLPLNLDWSGPGRRNPWAPSLDRIDPSKGYLQGNVRIVCVIFNLAKGDWMDDVVTRFREG